MDTVVPRPRRFGALWIILGIVVLLGIWSIMSYNSLVTAKTGVEASWAQVETQYQRRFDLVPNLVSTVKGAANFEQQTFVQVTQARSQFAAATTRDEKIAVAQNFESSLSRLLVTVEAYPQLKATQAFQDLMTQLEGTENRIGTARRDYNEEVRSYNLVVRRFPGSLSAGLFGFAPEKFFEGAPGSDQAPTVDFNG